MADAHPPAMLIGYLLLAAFATVNWLLHRDKEPRSGTIQMWLLFAAGVVVNIAFVTGTDDALAGPANLAMIAAVAMLLWQSRAELAPSGWKEAGAGAFLRVATPALAVGLALLTVLIYWVINDEIDFEALTATQEGVALGFDHTVFIAVIRRGRSVVGLVPGVPSLRCAPTSPWRRPRSSRRRADSDALR